VIADWTACDECHALIEARDLEGISRRAAAGRTDPNERGDCDRQYRLSLKLYRALLSHIQGHAEPFTQELKQAWMERLSKQRELIKLLAAGYHLRRENRERQRSSPAQLEAAEILVPLPPGRFLMGLLPNIELNQVSQRNLTLRSALLDFLRTTSSFTPSSSQ
jgi:hypothetical protein